MLEHEGSDADNQWKRKDDKIWIVSEWKKKIAAVEDMLLLAFISHNATQEKLIL